MNVTKRELKDKNKIEKDKNENKNREEVNGDSTPIANETTVDTDEAVQENVQGNASEVLGVLNQQTENSDNTSDDKDKDKENKEYRRIDVMI